MSERTVWVSGAAYETDFWVFNSSDAVVTGLVDGGFTKKLTKNGTHDTTTVTITEVDSSNQPGKYKATYTPPSNGYWSLRVTHATYNPIGWMDDIQTYTSEVLAGSSQTGDSYAIVNSSTFGNSKLVRATTPENTLDVSATGEAGIDWANVGSPTTTVGLTGTTISTSQAVASVTGAVGSVTGNVGGNVVGSVGAVPAGDIRNAIGLASANLDTQLATIGTAALSAAADALATKNIVSVDIVLDTTTDPDAWRVHYYSRGTTTDLIPPKLLKNYTGGAITAPTTPVASQVEA